MNARPEFDGDNGAPIKLDWAWQAQAGPQQDAIDLWHVEELFYGGAAGGGKSDFLLGDFLRDVDTYGKAWRGIIFRRTYPELEELLARSREIFPLRGATWNEIRRTWTFASGATLKMRYLERDADALRYQGHQYTWIGWDELTQWATDYPYRYLRSRLRSAHNVPGKRIRCAGNPGGPGHIWVKRYFIDKARFGYVVLPRSEVPGEEAGERVFIPSKLHDNIRLLANDPTYQQRLRALGGNLARALELGDWDIIEGAFFDRWSQARNVCKPFAIPDDWTRFRSGDWGSAKPFSFGWWAIARDDYWAETPSGRKLLIPRGCIVRYREWYGCTGKPNVGLKLTAEQVADGIKKREAGDVLSYAVLDPAAFSVDGGPSIAERMFSRGVKQRRADNRRVPKLGALSGWDQMRARINGAAEWSPDGQLLSDDGPGLVVFSTCTDFLRTVPVMQHDATNAEDIDTDMEDHVADETRYACMSRPYSRPPPRPKVAPPPKAVGGMTFDEIQSHLSKRNPAFKPVEERPKR